MGQNLILNYHGIIDSRTQKGHSDAIYSIQSSVFEEHLKILKELPVNIYTINELKKAANSELNVFLTFDDGHESDYEIAKPLLDKYGFKASFFISLINISENDQRWQQYRELAESGNTIGSHGVSHRFLSNLNKEQQLEELIISKKTIENKINREIDYFSLPGGMYNKMTIRLAKEIGYKGLLTTYFNYMGSSSIPYLLGRWSIKSSDSLETYRGVLQKNKYVISKIILRNRLNKSLSILLGHHNLDKLNYLFNS